MNCIVKVEIDDQEFIVDAIFYDEEDNKKQKYMTVDISNAYTWVKTEKMTIKAAFENYSDELMFEKLYSDEIIKAAEAQEWQDWDENDDI